MGDDLLRIDVRSGTDHVALTMSGVLDRRTYQRARDAIVKASIDAPSALVVDVTEISAPLPSAWSVFASAHWLVEQWPDVPMGLVCAHATGRRALARNGVARYLPVYGDAEVAVATLTRDAPVLRRRVRQRWPATSSSVPAAQGFVAHWLGVWGRADMIPTATVVVTALVDNVLVHTGSDPDVRLESDGDTVTVAVSDGSTAQAVVREDVDAARALSELIFVTALTRKWGNSPTGSGKTVWAVIGPENRL